MNKKSLIPTVLVAVVVVGFFIMSKKNTEDPVGISTPTPTLTTTPRPSPASSPDQTSKNVILYSDLGYAPTTLKVKKGEIVTFKNIGPKMMWTASAGHPDHKGYPGTDIALCGMQPLVPVFDACKGLGAGESWEFQFNTQGDWKYHNHMQPNHTGTITVE